MAPMNYMPYHGQNCFVSRQSHPAQQRSPSKVNGLISPSEACLYFPHFATMEVQHSTQGSLFIEPRELVFAEVEPNQTYSKAIQITNKLPTAVVFTVGVGSSERFTVTPATARLEPGEEKMLLVELRIRSDMFKKLVHKKIPIKDDFRVQSDFFEQSFHSLMYLRASATLPPRPPRNGRAKAPAMSMRPSQPKSQRGGDAVALQHNTELVEHNRLLREQLDALRTELAAMQPFAQALRLAEEGYSDEIGSHDDDPAVRAAVTRAIGHLRKDIEEKDSRVVELMRRQEDRVAELSSARDVAEQEARRSADRARITDEQLKVVQEDLQACTVRAREAEDRVRAADAKAERCDAVAREMDTQLKIEKAEWAAERDEKDECIAQLRKDKEVGVQHEHDEVGTLKAQVSALQAELDLARVDEQMHASRQRDLEEREQSMYAVIEQHSIAAADAEKSLRSKDQVISEKDEIIAGNSQQIADLESQLEDAKSSLDQTKSELADVQESLAAQKAEEMRVQKVDETQLKQRVIDLESLYAAAQETMREAERSSQRHAAIAHRLAGRISTLELEHAEEKRQWEAAGTSSKTTDAPDADLVGSPESIETPGAHDGAATDGSDHPTHPAKQSLLQKAFQRYARAEEMVRNLTFRMEALVVLKDDEIEQLKQKLLLAEIESARKEVQAVLPSTAPQVDDSQLDVNDDEDSPQHLKAQIAEHAMSLKRARYAAEEADLRVSNAEERCNELRTLVGEKTAQASDLSQEVARLTEELGQAVEQAHVHESVEKDGQQEPACSIKIQMQAREIERTRVEIDALQARLQECEVELSESRAESTRLAESCSKAQDDRVQAEAARTEAIQCKKLVASAEAAMREAECSRSLLSLEIEQQRMVLTTSQQETAAAQARANALEQELYDAQERQATVDRSLAVQTLERTGQEHVLQASHEAEIARLHRALESMQAKDSEMRERISEVHAERDAARDHISLLESQIADLRESAVAEKRAHGHDIEVARVILTERAAQLSTLQDSLDRLAFPNRSEQERNGQDEGPPASSEANKAEEVHTESSEDDDGEPNTPPSGLPEGVDLPFGTVLLQSSSKPVQGAESSGSLSRSGVGAFSDSVVARSHAEESNRPEEVTNTPASDGSADVQMAGSSIDHSSSQSAESVSSQSVDAMNNPVTEDVRLHAAMLTAQLVQAREVEATLQHRVAELHLAMEQRNQEIRQAQSTNETLAQHLHQARAEASAAHQARRELAERMRNNSDAAQTYAHALHNMQMNTAREQQLAVLKAVAQVEERAHQVAEERNRRMHLERADLEAQIHEAGMMSLNQFTESVDFAAEGKDGGEAGSSVSSASGVPSFFDPVSVVGGIGRTRKGVVLMLKELLASLMYTKHDTLRSHAEGASGTSPTALQGPRESSSSPVFPDPFERVFKTLQQLVLDLDSQLHQTRLSLGVTSANCRRISADRDARAKECERLRLSLAMGRSYTVSQLKQMSHQLVVSEKLFTDLHSVMQKRVGDLDREYGIVVQHSLQLHTDLLASQSESNHLRAFVTQMKRKIGSLDAALKTQALEHERHVRVGTDQSSAGVGSAQLIGCADCNISKSMEESFKARAAIAERLYDAERVRADSLGGVVLHLEKMLDGYVRREKHSEVHGRGPTEVEYVDECGDTNNARYHMLWLHAPREVIINRMLQADRDAHTARVAAIHSKRLVQRASAVGRKDGLSSVKRHSSEHTEVPRDEDYHSDPGHDKHHLAAERAKPEISTYAAIGVSSTSNPSPVMEKRAAELEQEVGALREQVLLMRDAHSEELRLSKTEAEDIQRNYERQVLDLQAQVAAMEELSGENQLPDEAPQPHNAQDEEVTKSLESDNKSLRQREMRLRLEVKDAQETVEIFRQTLRELEQTMAVPGDRNSQHPVSQPSDAIHVLEQHNKELAHKLVVSKATEIDVSRKLRAAMRVEKELRGLLASRNQRIQSLRGVVDELADTHMSPQTHTMSVQQHSVVLTNHSANTTDRRDSSHSPWFPIYSLAAPVNAPPSAAATPAAPNSSVFNHGSVRSTSSDNFSDSEAALRRRVTELEAELVHVRSQMTELAPVRMARQLEAAATALVTATMDPPPEPKRQGDASEPATGDGAQAVSQSRERSLQQLVAQAQAALATCQLARRTERDDLRQRVATLIDQREHLRDCVALMEGDFADARERIVHLERELETNLGVLDETTRRSLDVQQELDECKGELSSTQNQLDTFLNAEASTSDNVPDQEDAMDQPKSNEDEQTEVLKADVEVLEQQLAEIGSPTLKSSSDDVDPESGSKSVVSPDGGSQHSDSSSGKDMRRSLERIAELGHMPGDEIKSMLLSVTAELEVLRGKYRVLQKQRSDHSSQSALQIDDSIISERLSEAIRRAGDAEHNLAEMQAQVLKNKSIQDHVIQLYEQRIGKLKARLQEALEGGTVSKKTLAVRKRKPVGSVRATGAKHRRGGMVGPKKRKDPRSHLKKPIPPPSRSHLAPLDMDREWLEVVLNANAPSHSTGQHGSSARAPSDTSGAPSWIDRHAEMLANPSQVTAVNEAQSAASIQPNASPHVAVLAQRIVTLSTELRLAYSAADKLKEELDHHEVDITATRAENVAAHRAMEALQRDLVEHRRVADRQCDELQSHIGELERELRRRKTVEEWAHMQTKLRSVRESLRTATDECRRRADEISQLKHELDELREHDNVPGSTLSYSTPRPRQGGAQDIDNLDVREDRRRGASTSKRKDDIIRELRRRVSVLTDSLANASRTEKVHENRINALQAETARKDSAARAYKARLPEVQQQVEAERSARQAALKTISSLKQDAVRRDSSITAVRSKLEAVSAELGEWRGKYEAAQRAHREEIARLDAKSSEAKSRLELSDVRASECREVVKTHVSKLCGDIPGAKEKAEGALAKLNEILVDKLWKGIKGAPRHDGSVKKVEESQSDSATPSQLETNQDLLLAGSMVGLSAGDIAGILNAGKTGGDENIDNGAATGLGESTVFSSFIEGAKQFLAEVSENVAAKSTLVNAAIDASPTIGRQQAVDGLGDLVRALGSLQEIVHTAMLLTDQLPSLGLVVQKRQDDIRRVAENEQAALKKQVQQAEDAAQMAQGQAQQILKQLEICRAEGESVVARYEAKMSHADLHDFDQLARSAVLQGISPLRDVADDQRDMPAGPHPDPIGGSTEHADTGKDGGLFTGSHPVKVLKHPPTTSSQPMQGPPPRQPVSWSIPLVHEMPVDATRAASNVNPTASADARGGSAMGVSVLGTPPRAPFNPPAGAVLHGNQGAQGTPFGDDDVLDADSVLSFPDLDGLQLDGSGRGSIDSLFETLRLGLQTNGTGDANSRQRANS